MTPLRTPVDWITGGFDIHLVFNTDEAAAAAERFEQFVTFLDHSAIPHTRAMIFDAPVGPWPTPMWQVLLPQASSAATDLGHCIRWLMLNRGPFSVMIHPNTTKQGLRGGSIEDHSENMLWLGPPLVLRLNALK
jgi:DOPA 4,5-dioxygenase